MFRAILSRVALACLAAMACAWPRPLTNQAAAATPAPSPPVPQT